MKVIRDIIDNGKHIIHVWYEEHELEELNRNYLERGQRPEKQLEDGKAEGNLTSNA